MEIGQAPFRAQACAALLSYLSSADARLSGIRPIRSPLDLLIELLEPHRRNRVNW